jgi:hypothetical protein
LDAYRQMVAQRPLEEFYAHEAEEKQDLSALNTFAKMRLS